MSRDFGKRTAITSMATRGSNSAIGVIKMATASNIPTPRRIEWRFAEVLESRVETSTTKSLVLHVPDWPGHQPGQHVDIRLTAEDGYQAQRSYSIASPPEEEHVVLTV